MDRPPSPPVNGSASGSNGATTHTNPNLQITVPNTSTAPQPKPHIRYHVSIRLPLRSYTLQKRYSDFTVLQDQFIQVLGVPPPIPLPKKHFLSSTLNNPSLVEERRKGLEEYLQAIANSEDSRWRDSPPWRTFLNLPVLTKHSKRDERVSEEDWLEIHKQAKILLQDARQHLSKRSTAPTIKDQHSASAAAKRCLVLAGTKVTALQNGLNSVQSEKDGSRVGLGEGEIRRRRDLIRELNDEILGLERLSTSLATQRTTLSVPNASEQPTSSIKPQQTAVSTRRVFGAPQETERTKGVDNQGVLQLQTTIMKEQDEQMDEFLRQVRRTRGIAEQIHEELDSQIGLLEGLEEDVDRVEGKLKRATKRADKLK